MGIGNPNAGIGIGVGIGGGTGVGAGGRNIGGSYDTLPPFDPYILPNLLAYYDALVPTSITASAVNRVSQWNDLSGKGNNLLQATGANQPLSLPYAGTQYGYLPGVVGNYFSTPSNSGINIGTGPIGLIVKIQAINTVAGTQQMILDNSTSVAAGYQLQFFPTGSVLTFGTQTATVASTAHGLTTGTFWIKVTSTGSLGTTSFFKSTDGITYTAIGTGTSPVTTASGGALWIGEQHAGNIPLSANILSVSIFSDVACTQLVGLCNPSQAVNNATSWVSSTGETWTVNQSGAKAAQIVGQPSILTDAAAYFMATAGFTLAQPVTRYSVFKQQTWTANHILWDGHAAASGQMKQITTTPNLEIFAGSDGPVVTTFTLGKYAVAAEVLNGAGSTLQNALNSASTGNPGAGSPGGYTIGADGAGANFGALQLSESLLYSVAHTSGQIAGVVAYLKAKWGVS